MPLLINSKSEQIEDDWQRVEQVHAGESISNKSILSFADLLATDASSLPAELGVWLKASDDVEAIEPYLECIQKVVCIVDNFMDGRNFSQARILRDHYGFQGGIRVVGSFIQDQLFFLKRCGFDEFEMSDDTSFEDVSESLNDFSESYQAACDNSVPLFRRRS